jgi:dCMP deaminase
MSVADSIAKRSRCSRAQIGAVVISKDQRVSATRYNGPAATLAVEGDCIEWCPRAQGVVPLTNTYDSCPSIHAEANALLYVDRSRVEGGTIYITDAACYQCAKLISNAGIRRVVMRIGTRASHRLPDEIVEYFLQCNIEVTITKDVND